VLSSNIWKECNNNRKKIIEGAMRNAFGVDLTKHDEKENCSESEMEENNTDNDIAIEAGVLSSGDEVAKRNKIKQSNIERDKLGNNINKTTNIKSKNQAGSSENLNGRNSYIKPRNNKISGNSITSKQIGKRKDLKNQNKS
jgi:hypothetical protein